MDNEWAGGRWQRDGRALQDNVPSSGVSGRNIRRRTIWSGWWQGRGQGEELGRKVAIRLQQGEGKEKPARRSTRISRSSDPRALPHRHHPSIEMADLMMFAAQKVSNAPCSGWRNGAGPRIEVPGLNVILDPPTEPSVDVSQSTGNQFTKGEFFRPAS